MEASIEQRVQEETERRMLEAMSQMNLRDSEQFVHPNVIGNEDTEMIDTSSQLKKKVLPSATGDTTPTRRRTEGLKDTPYDGSRHPGLPSNL
jgi:hypothetical protein